LYGLGWLPGDTPFTLTAFSLAKDDFTIEPITQLPGSYIMMPECAFNPATNKLYFYSRNVGQPPHTMNIWEVDVSKRGLSNMWSINASVWSQPYMFHYNPTDNNMYAIIADGQLSIWLVHFDPSTEKDPIKKIVRLDPDQLAEPYAISYDFADQAFVYLNSIGEIVSVNQASISRIAVTGIPYHALRKISYLKK